MRADRGALAVLLVTGLAALASLTVAWMRWTLPSDGARLDQPQAWRPEAVRLDPLRGQPHGLRPGDQLVAIDDVPLRAWVAESAGPAPGAGDALQYTVLREDGPRQVRVVLSRFDPAPVLGAFWGHILFVLLWLGTSTWVFLRRPGEPAARAMFLLSAGGLTSVAWLLGLEAVHLTSRAFFVPFVLVAYGGFVLLMSGPLHFALVFPRPHPLVQRQHLLLPALYLVPLLGFTTGFVLALRSGAEALVWLRRASVAMSWATFLLYILGALALLDAYRRSETQEARRQIRLVVWAGAIFFLLFAPLYFLPLGLRGRPLISVNALGLPSLLLPLALVVAILRYRLFEIDLVIRRSLVYGSLTAVLGLVYLVTVVVLQSAFRALTGQESDLAIVVSTLGIAGLFRPLRHRLQNVIDLRFYRQQYDARLALDRFGQELRQAFDLGEMEERLREVMNQTVHPREVGLWLPAPGWVGPLASPEPPPRSAP